MMVPPSAIAQSSSVESRINRIENEIQTLSRAVFKGEKVSGNSAEGYDSSVPTDGAARAALEVRLSQMEMDLRTITGRVEELSYQMGQVKDKVDRTISDLEMRVSEVEQRTGSTFGKTYSSNNDSGKAYSSYNNNNAYSGNAPTGTAQLPTVVSGTPVASPPSQGTLGSLTINSQGKMHTGAGGAEDPAAVYEQAFSYVRNQQFDQAEQAFRAFLDKYPNNDLSQNAQYWLAETFYVRGQYETAARRFAEAYQSAPKGSKAPDNLLKMGMSLAGMGSVGDACVALSQVRKEFPDGAAPILTRAEQEIQRLGCEAQRN